MTKRNASHSTELNVAADDVSRETQPDVSHEDVATLSPELASQSASDSESDFNEAEESESLASQEAHGFTFTTSLPSLVTFDLANSGGTYVLTIAGWSHDALAKAVTHGIKQKVNDKMAGGPDSSTWPKHANGDAMTPREVADSVIDHIVTQGWSVRTGGGRMATSPLRAYVRDRAVEAAKRRIRTRGVVINNKLIQKLEPKLVAMVRDKYLADADWVAKMEATYQEIDVDLD